MIRLDGFASIPNFPVLATSFLITFCNLVLLLHLHQPRQLPRTAGPLRLWFSAYFLLIFGLMAVATRAGLLVVEPWRETLTTLPWIWTVIPFVYITVALAALYRDFAEIPATAPMISSLGSCTDRYATPR